MEKDPYIVLGVSENDPDEKIEKAYRTLAKIYHPDMNENKTKEEKIEAEEKFKEVSVAYAKIDTPEKRQQYALSKSNSFGSPATDFSNAFKDIFPPFSYSGFNFNGFQTNYQEQAKEIDFSEIEKLEQKIKEYDEVLKSVQEDIDELDIKIINQRRIINEEIDNLRTRKMKEEDYKKALDYIDKIDRKKFMPVIALTITSKQWDLYDECQKMTELLEKHFNDWKEKLKKERIEPLEIERQKKSEEKVDLRSKKSDLEKEYDDHPLKYQYEEFKQEQERKKEQQESQSK